MSAHRLESLAVVLLTLACICSGCPCLMLGMIGAAGLCLIIAEIRFK